MSENILDRVKLLMRYDTSRTLNENIITERDAVIGSDDDLESISKLLGSKKITGKIPVANINTDHVIYDSPNGYKYIFFRYQPGGYFNRQNFVILISRTNKAVFGTFDLQNMYLKDPSTPQNNWWSDKGFNEIVSLTSIKSTTPTNSDATKKDSNPRQEHINSIYCSLKNGIITAGGIWNGKKWEEYVKGVTASNEEIEKAKVSCKNGAKDKTNTGSGKTKSSFTPCQKGKYVKGCKDPKVKEVQVCLGMQAKYQTGNFGSITQGELQKLGKGFEKGFTDNDIQTICNSAKTKSKDDFYDTDLTGSQSTDVVDLDKLP